MQSLDETYANIILSNEFTWDQVPLAQLVVDGNGILNIGDIQFNREFGVLAPQVTITIPNVNPTDPSDTGYYNSQRNSSAHNKPATVYNGIIKPGEEFYIKMGYGDSILLDTIKVFTGIIDTVKVKITGSGDASLVIIGRGLSGRMVDRRIKKYNTSTAVTSYFITYPIETNIQTYYLTSADTNPYLYEIWRDITMRAGFGVGEADFTTYGGNNCTLRLNDIKGESFIDLEGRWIDIAQRIVNLMYYSSGGTTYNFFQYEDENGKLYLAMDNDFAYQGDDDITMTGTTWYTLPDADAWNYRAIKESIVCELGAYEIDVDFEYDMAGNKVRRTATSSMLSGGTFRFQYSFCAWTYKPNQIFSIEQWVSHDEIYGRLVAYNEESNIARSLDVGSLGDGTTVSTDKVDKQILTEYNTSTLLDNFLEQQKLEMKKNYFNLNCNVVGIPHLRIRDTICFLLWGTATAIYKIMGYNLNYNAENGFDMSIITRFYQNSGAV